jgi:Family of unknown function (DUF6789)
MSRRRTTPLGAVAKGIVAGAAGTGVMTAYQLAVARAMGSGSSYTPAEVGKRIIEGVLRREVPAERTETLNNVVHALYGTSWGPLYGIVQSSLHPRRTRHGVAFAALVWGASLVELPALGLAPPVWEMSPQTVALDFSYHLAYGLGVAGAYAVLGD